MAMAIPFKEIGKVGKRLLIQVAGITQNYKEETIVEEIDYATCPTECALQPFDVEKKKDICANHCPFGRQQKKTNVVYMNERHRYKIKTVNRIEDSRVSKYQLLQLLTYHFLGTDSKGFVHFVSTKELATELGCTVRTIKNNNQVLEKLGYISFHNYGADLFSLKITGYEDYHLRKEEGGTGYVQMTKGFLTSLFTLETVNVMRLAIRALLKFDNEVVVRKEQKCAYSYNDIKRFMPSNVNHKKIIDELLSKTSDIFEIEPTQTHVYITLKEEFNGKIQKEQTSAIFAETIAEQTQDIGFSSIERSNLVELALEYGIKHLLEAVENYHKYLQNPETPDVTNVGGFIRMHIERKLVNRVEKLIA